MICLKMFEVRLLSCATQRGGVCPEVLQREVKNAGCPVVHCADEQAEALLTSRASAAVAVLVLGTGSELREWRLEF